MRDRIYYQLALPVVHSGRTRTLPLRDIVPSAVDWNNISFLNGTPTTNNAVKMVGFTNQLTIRPSRNSGPNMTVLCKVCMFADKTGIVSSTSIGVGGTQLVSVMPGQYVFFECSASRSVTLFTVSIVNYFTSTAIDTFTAQAI